MTLTPCGFKFGVTDGLIVNGFEVIQHPDEWAMAKQGEKEFFVEEKGGGYRLFPSEQRGAERICRTDKAIYIAK